MTDLVERLRGDRCEMRWPCTAETCACNLMDEASNAILRLRAINAELVKALRNVLYIAEGYPMTGVQAERYMRHARVTLSRAEEQPHD